LLKILVTIIFLGFPKPDLHLTDVLSFLKPSSAVPVRYEKQVFIVNILSILFSAITFGIFGIFYSLFGNVSSLIYIFLAAVLFLAIPAINRIDSKWGRVAFCAIPVLATVAITLYFKIEDKGNVTYISYFDSRFILMAATILPGIVFRLEERLELILVLAPNAMFVYFFDPIHELFGVGYYQRGFNDISYNYMNYIVGVTYSVLLFGILLLRSILERSEADLIKHNRELVEKQNEIEAQHEELMQHQEEILTSSEKLENANSLIMRQREALEKYNETLEALVEQKSFELLKTNEELIKHNNELLQFSYTVSHNVRGPVARMLGLTRLLKRTDNLGEQNELQEMILKSSEELDEILKDLSLIIDIRNDLYRVREKVFLQDEWNKAVSLLGDNVKSVYNLKVDFSEAPFIFAVRPMIQSIFYNLFSNAIKYQSPDRKLRVDVKSIRLEDDNTLLTVSDNGLGIDLQSQHKNIFKLYKRFHSHVTGKGLGLYLVKTQLESLGATISVESAPNEGTTFSLLFPQPEEISRQVFFDNEAVELCYDGNRNIIMMLWKRHSSSKEFREAFETVRNSLHLHESPGLVSDVRRTSLDTADQYWLEKNILPDLVRCGLKKMAMTGVDHLDSFEMHSQLKNAADALGFEFRLFENVEQSLHWMEDVSVPNL
jgi:signal transduction histidine kinase